MNLRTFLRITNITNNIYKIGGKIRKILEQYRSY